MILRRDRILLAGISNADYRSSKSNDRYKNLPRIDTLATPKNRKFDEIIKERLERTSPNPIQQTAQLYNETDKSIKTKLPLGKPRESQLEQKEKMKVFTGDSQLIFEKFESDDNSEKRQKRLAKQEQQKKEKLINEKQKTNTGATAETQLITFENNKETLDGKVDLVKIKELRKALRRKYGNRKNFQKIFAAWDKENTGKITVSNAYDMLKQLGFNCNMDEARVLIATQDEDNNGSLELAEFISLIFTDNEALNFSLKRLPVLTNEETQNKDNQIMQNIGKDASEQKQKRHQNQLYVVLKNKFNSIAQYMRNEDASKLGTINQERYNNVMKRLGIPESIMYDDDVKQIFDKHKIDDHRFNYQNFLTELQDFTFSIEDIYRSNKEKTIQQQKSQSFIQKQLTMFKKEGDDVYNQEIHIFDANKIDGCQLEKIRKSATKVIQTIQRYFPDQKDLRKFFQDQLGATEEAVKKSAAISKSQLTDVVGNIVLNFCEKSIKKKEVERFLSIFNYNIHDYADTNEVFNTIYNEEEREWYKRIQGQPKRPPPPPQLLFHSEFQPMQDQITEPTSQPITQRGDVTATINEQKDEEDHTPPIKGDKSMKRISSQPIFQKNLEQILQKFENRIFVGSTRSYDVFKMFDIDQDGYISQKDMVNKLKELNILQRQEIQPLLDYIDPEQKGYVTFQEFSSKLRAGMTNNDSMGKQIVIPYIYPDKTILVDDKRNSLPLLRTIKEDIRSTLRPDENVPKATRFSGTPQMKNTFLNFQAPQGSGMFQSNQDRFNQNRDHKIQFQKEEKDKKLFMQTAKLERIQYYQQKIDKKTQDEFNRLDMRENAINKAKGLIHWTYEHRAHLKNDIQ